MTITTCLDEPLFALGFRHGADADEEPPALEFQSRVLAFRLGYVVGRSFAEAVHQANHATVAETAGRLGVRYGVDLNALLNALKFSDAQRDVVRQAYTTEPSKPSAQS